MSHEMQKVKNERIIYFQNYIILFLTRYQCLRILLFDVWSHFNQKKLAFGRETVFLYSDLKKLLTNCFLLTKLDLNGKNILGVKLTHNQKVKRVYRKIVSCFAMDGE